MMTAMIMRDSLMLLITAHLFNQLAQREMLHINTMTNRGKQSITVGHSMRPAGEKRETKNTRHSCHSVTVLEVRLRPETWSNKIHRPTQTIMKICINTGQFSYSQLKVAATENIINRKSKEKRRHSAAHTVWLTGDPSQVQCRNFPAIST